MDSNKKIVIQSRTPKPRGRKITAANKSFLKSIGLKLKKNVTNK